MNMNYADSQIPLSDAPANVYLLQMDSNINLSSSEHVLPLHLLDNSLEYGRNQCILPNPSKQRGTQDQLQILIDSCQEPAKIMGLLVDKNYQYIQNLLPVSNQHQKHSIECSNTEELSIERSGKDFIKPELNVTVQVKNEKSESTQNYVHISDRSVPPRALAVLPTVLQIQRRHIISTRRTLPKRARFGPVQGIKYKISHSEAVEFVLNATSNKKPLFLVKDEDDLITHIDISDKEKSNWIGLLPLGDQNSANVWLYEENHDLYAITTEIIPSRKPLKIGYSQKYAEDYGLIGPTKDLEAEESELQKPWWCYECQRVLPSANLLQRHMELYHKVKSSIRPRSALRRHNNLHCPTKSEIRSNAITTKVEPNQINLNSSLCSEDNRLPSDESFQNYTNGLDFSTNLFDTDRIPSLDISGNSRCDNDFTPYSIGYKDENSLANDLDFTNRSDKSQTTQKQKQPKSAERFRVPCSYCNQLILKEKRRQHVSECPARRLECECKKVFTNKKQFENHIFTQHANKSTEQQNDSDDSSAVSTDPLAATQYKCEQCQHNFKRRGMLVNHLWRVHNTVSARVPLERRVRHYPCVICPKIYRTAAKRDRHVLLHHPGAEKVRGQALEGGTRLCEPAMCSACPRQYATRAKLLQHQRANHPHLVPPPQNKKPMKAKSRDVVNTLIV